MYETYILIVTSYCLLVAIFATEAIENGKTQMNVLSVPSLPLSSSSSSLSLSIQSVPKKTSFNQTHLAKSNNFTSGLQNAGHHGNNPSKIRFSSGDFLSAVVNKSRLEKLGNKVREIISEEIKRLYEKPEFEGKIDAVLTWVNASDSSFKKEFDKPFDKSLCKVCSNGTDSESFANRFHSTNEILLNLMSLCYQNSWIRKIYIVSNEHFNTSYFLPICQDRIVFIPHNKIIDSKHLPVYNSNLIEACLYRIPGLSEIYWYLNDDIMFTQTFDMRKLIKKQIETPITIPSSYFGKGLCNLKLNTRDQKLKSTHFHVYFNTYFMFSDRLNSTNCYPWSQRGHTPFLQVKSLNQLAWELFPNETHHFYSNRFRFEVNYKAGGDFSLLYLSNYLGKYFNFLDFTNRNFTSAYPRKPEDFMKVWKDSSINSIIMHDKYNAFEKHTRYEICTLVLTKSCNAFKLESKNNDSTECLDRGMYLCDKELRNTSLSVSAKAINNRTI